MAYEVPPLPYDYAALEPHIDEATMKLHHDKHHAAYVAGANTALEKLAEAREAGAFDTVNLLEKNLAFNLGGVLRREAVQGGKAVGTCVFNKVGDKCTVNFIQEGEGEGKVEKAELKGAEAAVRYKNAKAGCTAGKVLKENEKCSDEIELLKVAAKTENEWCVTWDLGALTEVPFCVGLKQP